MTAHLWPASDGHTWTARLEAPGWSAHLFYDRVDEPLGPMVCADAILIGTLLAFMSRDVKTLRVHGDVSRTLLRNLDELQHVWLKWRPELYSPVMIEVDGAIDDVSRGEGAISAFSGGVDAAFPVYRHAVAATGWHALSLHEVVMIHGFDIGLDEPDVFDRAVDRAERMLAGTGLRLSRVRTNLRDLPTRWGDNFALGVASVLTLFADRRDTGLIGSSEDYGAFFRPCGSTPVQDWMASSAAMAIRHDGAGFSRTEKVTELAKWQPAIDHMRVCYRGAAHDRNCGRCEKCIRTALNLRLAGVESPTCFDAQFTTADLRRVYFANGPMAAEWKSLITEAERRGIAETWVRDVRRVIRREQLKATPAGRLLKRLRSSG
jgi:hypothetical protein